MTQWQDDYIERLEAALEVARTAMEEQINGGIDRPIGRVYRVDGARSRHDQCIHGAPVCATCEDCIDAHFVAALAKIDEILESVGNAEPL